MSSDTPLVSILIPTYNAAPYLGNLCRSILAQTYQNFEVLIADDGSTDNTLDVLAPFRADSRFQILTWDKNLGVSQATLPLFHLAKGEFWCHPGADDLLEPQFIQERLSRLRPGGHAAILHGQGQTINERGKPLDDVGMKLNFPAKLESPRALRVLLQHNIIQTPSVMVSTSVTKSILPLLSCDWKYAQDWYFWILHLATGFDLLWDAKPLHKYRIHSGSLSLTPSKTAIRQAEVRLVPLCGLSRAAQFSNLAMECWKVWRRSLYHLWLRRACNLARSRTLKQEWLELGASSYYGTSCKNASLRSELRAHLLGIILTSWKERKALRNQRFRVSGMAQINDPIFW